jgi:nucleoside diphosphate kinase
MYAPSPDGDFIQRYCDAIYDPEEKEVPLRYQKMLIEYVMKNFGRPNILNISNRLMLLLFKGPNAQEDIKNAVGHIGRDVRGDDVRGTFGDFVLEDATDKTANLVQNQTKKLLANYPALQKIEIPERRSNFFEPAVLTGVTPEMTTNHLKLFYDKAYSDGGYVLQAMPNQEIDNMETSMVILKPESFRKRNPLPGNLIDFFARTGMFITGAKITSLSVKQAKEFYAAKLPQFEKQLKGMIEEKGRQIVKNATKLSKTLSQITGEADNHTTSQVLKLCKEAESLFSPPGESRPGAVKKPVTEKIYAFLNDRLDNLHPDDSVFDEMKESLKTLNAEAEFNELIRYMSGKDPATGKRVNKDVETKCMALLYSGPDSLSVIRRRLKELRKVYGQNILHNRAHASDPEEDPVAETRILGMPNSPEGERRPCDVVRVIDSFYHKK